MGTQNQLNLPPLPVHRVERRARVRINPVDTRLEDARQAIARAVAKAITRTGTPLKELGDKAQVSRWTKGENPVLARLWLCQNLRREFVLALAEESGMSVEVTVRAERIA